MDVPFHNELRLFIGEGPLLGDMDIGSSRRLKLLLCRRRDMAFGRSQAGVPVPVWASYAAKQPGTTCVTLVPEPIARHSPLMVLAGYERHENLAGTGVLREFIASRCAFHERLYANCAARQRASG